MARHPELSDDENIERSIERFGYFEGDRHASAWQRKNDNIASAGVMAKLRGQLGPRFAATGE
jgi:hypothetical protein